MTRLRDVLLRGEIAGWMQSGGTLEVDAVPPGAWPVLAAAIARVAAESGRSTLILARHPEAFLANLRPWLSGAPATGLFAEVPVSFLDRPPAMDASFARRLDALAMLAGPAPVAIVSSRRAMQRPTISAAALRGSTVDLRPGLATDPAQLATRLVELGYSREPMVEAPGQFALRGGILDVFPTGGRTPVRAEFVGDEIESLRLFDLATQRSVMAVPELAVRPGREMLLGPERGRRAAEAIRTTTGLAELRGDVRADWDDDLGRLAEGGGFPGIEYYAAYLDPSLPTLLDHLPAATVVVDLAPDRQRVDALDTEAELEMLLAAEIEQHELPRGFLPATVKASALEPRQSVVQVHGGQRSPVGQPALPAAVGDERGTGVDAGWGQAAPVVQRPRDLNDAVASGLTVIAATEQKERLDELARVAGVALAGELELDVDAELTPGLVHADWDLEEGFSNPSHGLLVLSDGEMFGRLRKPAARRSRGTSKMPTVSLEFQPGELVVHVDHGVARFLGMKLIEGDGADREYLELEYADGDRLFVPVETLDRVQKYLGGSEAAPSLHRLGTADWSRARSRARKVVEDIAEDLIRTYALREAKPGFAFEADSPWQQELEASFPYEETPDQLAAMAEIKADMEADRPMDRLLCGDVGFGKTELALRAAFKCVQSGKQVAVLVPTTILAQQHFQVFSDRLAPFPLKVDLLSRFRSDEEQAVTIAGIRAGTVDIVIGTHRILQKDVRFKRLGLVVIDEEQRFGVVQKERLKRLRTQVDVLTLSATPIPRTLHMAVSGIRDMSVIQTPPEDRQPIKTYVTADDDELVAQVIERELERGGQVYFLHNRVRTIHAAADRISRLVPTARVGIGHGQMEEDQLTRVMSAFTAREYDVLVCTTIIESGLDIPNVNTMIVQHADRFGLAQLYQLRGRVGRAGKRAYCYFLFDPQRSLTENADKRLDVMAGLHELGLGFKIALRDLEIRGGGNLLGSEQSGAIAAVGFEMYVQMLNAAINRVRAGGDEAQVADVLSTPEINVDLPLDHFIPRSFIRDERLRLGSYRELAAATDETELDGQLRSLRDRFGELPAQLDNLAFSLRVKLRGQRIGLRSVAIDGDSLIIRVDPDRHLDVDELGRRMRGRLRIQPNRLRMTVSPDWMAELMDLIEILAELYNIEKVTAR